MEIRPKSQAELNSQAMSFAAYEIQDNTERDEIAAMSKMDVGNVATHDLYPKYADYLRRTRGNRQENIRKRTELQNKYVTDFKPIVDGLRESLNDSTPNSKNEAFINSGATSTAFSIEKNGKEYVVRTINEDAEITGKIAIDKYVAGTARVEGLPHFEQIVGISYEDEISVAERMPGKSPSDMSLEDIRQITDSQLADLIDTLKVAQAHDIKIDSHAGNYLYDKDQGFGLIDFDSIHFRGVYREQSLGDKIAQATRVLGSIGNKNVELIGVEPTTDLLKARLDLLQRLGTIIDQTDLGSGDHWRVPMALESEIDFLKLQLNGPPTSPQPPFELPRHEVSHTPVLHKEGEWEVPKAPAGIHF